MTSMIAEYVSRKIFKETWENEFGLEDLTFEGVPATRLHHVPLKKGKRYKALSDKISEHDYKILTKVKRRAYHLDMGLFNCCGIRFGWGSAIGIIPGIGDVLDALMAIAVVGTCRHIEGGLPAHVRLWMYLNIVLDFVIGLVPILGDIAAAMFFRPNTRNAIVLEKYLQESGGKRSRYEGA